MVGEGDDSYLILVLSFNRSKHLDDWDMRDGVEMLDHSEDMNGMVCQGIVFGVYSYRKSSEVKKGGHSERSPKTELESHIILNSRPHINALEVSLQPIVWDDLNAKVTLSRLLPSVHATRPPHVTRKTYLHSHNKQSQNES